MLENGKTEFGMEDFDEVKKDNTRESNYALG
jgi:hypothetical protein